MTTGYQAKVNSSLTAVIASSGTASGAVDLQGLTLCGFIMPATFTGTLVTFTCSDTLAGTYVPVYDATNTQKSVTVSASRYYALNPSDFAGIRFIKLVSGSAEGAERTITLAARPI